MSAPDPDSVQAVAALCAAHPGPAPVLVSWSDGNGSTARLRARNGGVELSEDFLTALKEIVGKERVRLVKANK